MSKKESCSALKKKHNITSISKKEPKDRTIKEKLYLERKYTIRADNAFAKYIRAKEKYCIICGSSENIQCSHYYVKKAHKSVRWDERNAHAMCASCHYRHHKIGEQEYAEWMIKNLKEEYDLLKIKAYSTCFLALDELIDIEIYYTRKLEEL
jgi:hypothetical protein